MSITFFDTELAYALDKNLKKVQVKALVKWVDSQPHLPKINEPQAILFLRRWKYQTDLVHDAVDSYFTFRNLCSDLYFSQNLLKSPSTGLGDWCITVLPKKTPEDYHIIFFKAVNCNPRGFNYALQVKYLDMVVSSHSLQEISLNYVMAIDMKDFPPFEALEIDPLDAKKCFYHFQHVAPLNIKGIHYFNITPAFEQFFGLIKPHLTSELARSIYVHETVEELVKYIPKDCLPKDYGGPFNSVSVYHGKMKETFLRNCALFEWTDAQKVDERKRPKESKILKKLVTVVKSAQKDFSSHFTDVNSEYLKDTNLKKSDVKEVLDWVHSQPHLPKISELQAILFLQKEKYQKKLAKDAIDSYFTYKTLHSDIFLKRNPFHSPLKEDPDRFLFTVLPKETPDGYRIIFAKILDPDVENIDFITQLKHFDMNVTLDLYQNGNTKGFILLSVPENISFSFIQKNKPHFLKTIFYYFKKISPIPLQEIHYFNLVPYLKDYLSIIKPFFPQLYCHETQDDLLKRIPRECLPQDYGGLLESTTSLHEKAKTSFFENAALFDWEDGQTVDETKRPEGSKILDDILTFFDSFQTGLELTFADVEPEFRKNKNLKKQDVDLLLEWASNQPHLPEINERQAILFLRRWQYQLNLAKDALDSYFTYKTFYANLFLGKNPFKSPLKEALDLFFVTVLPKKTPEGHSIIFGNVTNFNLDRFDICQQIKHFDLITSLHLYQEEFSPGFIIVFDAEKFVPEIMPKLTFYETKTYFHYIMEVAPYQILEVHFFNCGSLFDDLVDLVTGAVKEENKEKIFFHRHVEELIKRVPKECLPKDYGGSAEKVSVLNEITKFKLFTNAPLFDWEDSQTVDETKRSSKDKALKDILAVVGFAQKDLPHLYMKSESEFATDKNLKRQEVKLLIEWVDTQPYLPKINEIQAIRFLQRWQYQLDGAKNAIDSYFTYKTFFSDTFLGRNPFVSPLKQGLEVMFFTVLPKKTPDGLNIIFCTFQDTNVDHFDFATQIKHLDMVTLMHLYQEGNSEGYVVVADFQNFSTGLINKLDPANMKRHFRYVQEVAPFQWKAFHIFNPTSLINDYLSLVKPTLKSQLLENLYVHNTLEDLFKYVPEECLPRDYGGLADDISVLHEKTKKKFQANASLFDWEDKQTTREHLRPDKYKAIKDICSVVHGDALNGQNGTHS